MTQTDPERPRMTQKWLELTQTDQNWLGMTQKRPRMTRMWPRVTQFESLKNSPEWAKLTQNDREMTWTDLVCDL